MTGQRRNNERQIILQQPEVWEETQIVQQEKFFEQYEEGLYVRSLRREARQNLYNFVV